MKLHGSTRNFNYHFIIKLPIKSTKLKQNDEMKVDTEYNLITKEI